ncbi:MAG: YeeE/YedE family protein [Alcanivoracaceae bacterium]|nr:YeeE/YedE family protein [Alcanivoracaceae bacterium]
MPRHLVSAFVVGLLFGFGLLLSGLANPAKVLGFLDIAGAWDPSLMLVMGGAVVVAFFAFLVAKKRHVSFLGEPMRLPSGDKPDLRLIVGSLGFGIGWGLVGFCPGPALVALGTGAPKAIVFVAAMVAGMFAYELIEGRKQSA